MNLQPVNELNNPITAAMIALSQPKRPQEHARLWLLLSGSLGVCLFAYCVGHGWFMDGPIDPGSSAAWAFNHGAALATMGLASNCTRRYSMMARMLFVFGTSLTSLIAVGFALGLSGPFNYITLSVYALMSLGLCLATATDQTPVIIEVDFGRSSRLIDVESIASVKASRNYLELHIQDGEVGLIRQTLTDFLAAHDKSFCRIHRSYLVNFSAITTLQKERGRYRALLTNGETVPISTAYLEEFQSTTGLVPEK